MNVFFLNCVSVSKSRKDLSLFYKKFVVKLKFWYDQIKICDILNRVMKNHEYLK